MRGREVRRRRVGRRRSGSRWGCRRHLVACRSGERGTMRGGARARVVIYFEGLPVCGDFVSTAMLRLVRCLPVFQTLSVNNLRRTGPKLGRLR